MTPQNETTLMKDTAIPIPPPTSESTSSGLRAITPQDRQIDMDASSDLAYLVQRLESARAAGDPDALTDALALHANGLVARGQLGQAAAELDELIALYRARGRRADEAKHHVLAATLYRLLRQLPEAQMRAERAAELTGPGSTTAVSAATELGEIALAAGDGSAAADAFGRALTEGETSLLPATRVALLRKRAAALAALSRHDAAARDLELAERVAAESGDHPVALVVLVERATALQQGGDPRAAAVRDRAMHEARAASDHNALAQLYLLQATDAVQRRLPLHAETALRAAREHALAGVLPVPYMTASMALSELAGARGDRVSAYEALVVGWVTLADLLGREPARIAFEPKLRALREQWGPEAFAAVKAAYEGRRQREIARGQ